MIDNQDFSMDAEEPALRGEPAVPPPPKVVIEYRDRGLSSLLIPPLLILLLVLVILSSRRGTPILAPTPTPIVSQTAPKPVVEPEPAEPLPGPVVVRTELASALPHSRETASVLPELPDLDELMPSPLIRSSTAAGRPEGAGHAPAGDSKPEEPAADKPVDSPQGVRPGAETEAEAGQAKVAGVRKIDRPLLLEEEDQEPPPEPVVAADPPPEVSKEEILEDIRDEAARKAAEIRRIKELQPQVQYLEISRILKKAEANRAPFHKSLKALVRSRRPQIGRDIEALCNEIGRDTLPQIRVHIMKILATTYARSPLKIKVEMMRTWGLPEPVVFDYVANQVSRQVGTRGGPKDRDEVGLRAARMLLAMPPATPPGRSVAGSVPVSGSAPSQSPH